ncbi:hypothetical protein [Agarivorans sp. OAG1]|uniref:hypothetical protein n=1 Tax=Agarivorans sp. OAG1 TaxID=3082387 RepID=UPI0030CBD678
MNIEEKELGLIEDNLEKLRVTLKKSDSTAVVFLISSIILYTTTDPSTSIKIAMLGVELKSIYAIYIFFLLSLVSILNYSATYVKSVLLYERYLKLFRSMYGDVPNSVHLIFIDDHKVRKNMLRGRWVLIDHLFHLFVTVPIFTSYFYMAYELVRFSIEVSKFELICSGLIVIIGVYTLVLMWQVIYINHVAGKAIAVTDD